MTRKKLLISVSVIALAAAGAGLYLAPLAADPAGEKDCGSVLPQAPAGARWVVELPAPERCTGRSAAGRSTMRAASAGRRWPACVAVRREADVAAALAFARAHGLTVSAAGVQPFDGRPGLRAAAASCSTCGG